MNDPQDFKRLGIPDIHFKTASLNSIYFLFSILYSSWSKMQAFLVFS